MMLKLGLILLWTVAVMAVVAIYQLWWYHPNLPRGSWKAIDSYLMTKLNPAIGKNLGSAALILIDQGEIVASHSLGMANSEAPVRVCL
jgi:hypothetical protein